MCGGPERSKSNGACETRAANLPEEGGNVAVVEKQPSKPKEVGESCSCLLELAANNDLIGFKQAVEDDVSKIDKVSFWYGRKHGSKQMVFEQRTPLMIAALYGSVDVLNYILSASVSYGVDINRGCGSDNSTALHCAAAGGSISAVETVKLLIQAGADIHSFDAFGRRPADMIMLSPKLRHARAVIEEMLNATVGMGLNSANKVPSMDSESSSCLSECVLEVDANSCGGDCNSSESISPSSSSPLSSSPEASYSLYTSSSPNFPEPSKAFCDGNEKKEYPVDPSLPDIKNSIYSTDEFRMFSFKVRPCSRAYSHDWTECPFVHPGENARRRDPRRYHYSCVPCPDFRKGACRRGDACEYAHGVFESWLHPAQYRTRLCKDGMTCERRVCFFAHRPEELRPLYVSTGSAMPSLRTSAPLDVTSAMSPLAPGSPSSVLMMSPFSPSNAAHGSLLTPPMSPSSSSANTPSHSSLGGAWSQSNLPALHLPGGGFQASRLRAALHARDLSLEELTRGSDYEGQIISEFSPVSTQARVCTAVVPGSGNSRSGKYRSHSLSTVAPTNLEDLFGSDIPSPRVVDVDHSVASQMSPQMQSHKTMHVHSQLQKQMQLSVNTQMFPQVATQMQQVAVDHQSAGHSISQASVMSPSYGLSSLGWPSSFGADLEGQKSNGSSILPVMSAALNSRAVAFSQRERRSFSSRDLGASPSCSSDWGSPTGKVDWGVQAEELSKFRKSVSFGFRNSDEQDLPWIQSLGQDELINSVDGGNLDYTTEISNNGHLENGDHVGLASWFEQMDQLVS